ncbi:MAG: PepSY domain-containing protein [Nitrospira sp.]|nr:MAG: PepSY domain-containing protein [Nitrospira sp.]
MPTEGMRRCRHFWVTVHLWLGLSAGAALVLIGLAGSILVFWPEIDEWLNPHLLQVEPHRDGQSSFFPIDDIWAAVMQAMPPGSKPTSAYYPRHDAVAYHFNVLVPSVPEPQTRVDFSLHHVFVNPYTGTVTGVRLVRPAGWAGMFPRTFIEFVFGVHYALLLPRTGDPPFGDTVVGILGLTLIISLCSGMYLWWTTGGPWRSALTINWQAHIRRVNFDMHKAAGLACLCVLLGLFVSGVYLNLPRPFHSVVRIVSPTIDRVELQSRVPASPQPISLGHVVDIVRARLPEGRIDRLYFPRKPTGTYTICHKNIEGLSLFLTRRCVVIDQYSGEILHIESPDHGTVGEYFIQWQWPLHSGQAFGLTGRWVVFVAGLICPVLFGTGFYLWWRKRAGRIRARSMGSL